MSKSSVAASRQKLLKLVQIALLTAIIAIMAFIPSIGYIRTPLFEITLIVVPVSLGAVLLGPSAGLFLGTVFGLTSFIQCFGMSQLGVALMSVNPIFTFIVCMIPRMLMGWLTGLIFKAVQKIDKTKFISYLTANIAGPLLNTILFTSTLFLLFSNAPVIADLRANSGAANIFTFAVWFVSANGLIEAAISAVVGTAISKALAVALKKIKI